MSWLARLDIPEDIVRAQKMFDTYAWHQRIWQDCFDGQQPERRDFLTRIDPLENAYRLWIMAMRKTVRPYWCPSESFSLKEIAPSFFSHRYYAFDLRANPTRCLVQRMPDGEPARRLDGRRKPGKRVPLVKTDDLIGWLERKASTGGFHLVDTKPLEIGPMIENHFRKKPKGNSSGHVAYHGNVQFRGVLEVTDRKLFISTYHAGIGGAKSFGFGLLLIAPFNYNIIR